jgi:hypothetical protein
LRSKRADGRQNRWGQEEARLGWQSEGLFGLHPTARMARHDCMGLIWMLRGERVVELTAKTGGWLIICGRGERSGRDARNYPQRLLLVAVISPPVSQLMAFAR